MREATVLTFKAPPSFGHQAYSSRTFIPCLAATRRSSQWTTVSNVVSRTVSVLRVALWNDSSRSVELMFVTVYVPAMKVAIWLARFTPSSTY